MQKQSWSEFGKEIGHHLWRAFGVGAIIGAAIALGPPIGRRVFESLENLVGLHPVQVLLCFTVMGAGAYAFWFKRRNQLWYGIVEVMFGSASGVAVAFGITSTKASLSQWATLVGCAYVIARGLNNCAEAEERKSGLVR